MKFRYMGLLLALLASSLLSTTMAIAQEPAPTGPAGPPSETDAVRAEAAPAALAAQGLVYAGGHKGAWLIFGPTSRGTFQDYANPPRYYANSMTFAGTLGAYWVFNLDGFAGPPQFAFLSNSTTGSYPIYYRSVPNVGWGTPFDTTGRGPAIGNQR